MQGTKWGGLLPISNFGSRHSRWCHDRNGVGSAIGTPVSPIKHLCARRHLWEGLLLQASLGALSQQRAPCRDRGGSLCVAIETLVSLHGAGQ